MATGTDDEADDDDVDNAEKAIQRAKGSTSRGRGRGGYAHAEKHTAPGQKPYPSHNKVWYGMVWYCM